MVVIFAEDTGPFNACPGACFWHCTLPDATRKATPSQPSRGRTAPWIRMAQVFLAGKPAGARMRYSVPSRVGSTLLLGLAGHSFSSSQPVSTSSSLLTSPFTSSLHILLTTVEHGVVLDLMSC